MIDNPITVAADIGNSKIVMMASRRNIEGQLEILGMEEMLPPADSIRNGIILNASNIGMKVSNGIKLLENRIKHKIDFLYVAYNGHSLRSVVKSVGRNLNNNEVTEELLEQMRDEILTASTPEGRVILDVFPQSYLLDNEPIQSPIETIGQQIIGRYLAATSKPSLRDNLQKSFQRITVDADVRMGPMMVADAVMNESEKQLGCAVIDFGAGCTSVAVYKDGVLQHFAVIPFGGRHITSDLTFLNLLEPTAEQLKVQNGCALKSAIQTELKTTLPAIGQGLAPQEISNLDIAEIIEARQREIIQLILSQVEKSGVADQLGAGLLMTGGASNMLYIDRLLEELSGMKVRRGSHADHLAEDKRHAYSKPEYALVIGLLLNGTRDCCPVEEKEPEIELPKIPEVPPTPPKQEPVKAKSKRNPFKGWGNGIANLFSDESDMD